MGVKLDFLLEHTIPCVEEVPVCGDTCNKPLACGEHLCIRSCHYGDCGQVCCIMSIKRGRGGRDGTRGYRCTLILLHCGVCVCVCVFSACRRPSNSVGVGRRPSLSHVLQSISVKPSAPN